MAAVALGAGVAHSSAAAAGVTIALAIGTALVWTGPFGIAQASLAALPWLIVFDALIPAQLRTLVTVFAVIVLLVALSPLTYRRPAILGIAAVFGAVVIAHAIYATNSEQFIQAAKYAVFPAMSLAVLSGRATELLPRARMVLLASGVAALLVHLAIVTAGLGEVGTYYGVGEKLGYAEAIPHEMALLAVIVAAAGLVTAQRVPAKVMFFAVGAVPAVLTGVRSALLAIVLILLVYAVQTAFSPRTLAVLAGIVLMAFASGAAQTVTERFNAEAEFSSVSSVGSGRGAIYEVALDGWRASGIKGWVFGTGLRSVALFSLERLGVELVGHSDLVEVGVQLGLVGLVAWLLIWAMLFTGHLRVVVLLPVAAYAAVNGSIEYVAPLTVGLALAAACVQPSPRAAGDLGGGGEMSPRRRGEPAARGATGLAANRERQSGRV
ncbi:MAG: O-antigen ligase family protein, partial [Actinomycetota bacterium]|nr:O-antigen ligase family protein [Actinomycetota bacterium]